MDELTEDEAAIVALVREFVDRDVKPVVRELEHATAFGSDNCYGLSWSLLHLIETAPGARHARCPHAADSMWVQLLAVRVEGAS